MSLVKLCENECSAVYRCGPFECGEGIAIGNALRRVMLSSCPGTAIDAVKVISPDSVFHEFSSIRGIKEDSLL